MFEKSEVFNMGTCVIFCAAEFDSLAAPLKEGDYLDVGTPVGPAIPVVVKTLILSR